MAKAPSARLLLVEGLDDLFIVAEVFEKATGLPWEPSPKQHPDARPAVRPWKDVHADKAEMHTWLAWQDPPGLQLHEAVLNQLLDVQAPLAQAFVGWMRRLYEL